MLEILAHPLVSSSLAALAVAICACVSILLKRDVRRIHAAYQEQQRTAATQIRELTLQVASLEEGIRELEKKAASLPQMSPPKPGMTESRRVQVLRMYKRGERAEQIAAALGLPLNEVDLLVKVHHVIHPG